VADWIRARARGACVARSRRRDGERFDADFFVLVFYLVVRLVREGVRVDWLGRFDSVPLLIPVMFEKQLTAILNAKLGRLLEGIDPEDVRVGVIQGDVVIRRVRVRASALTRLLDEPSLRVRYGFVDELRLRIPWRKLGEEPVRATFSGVYIVGEIDDSGEWTAEESEEERLRKQQVKARRVARRAVEAAEQAWLKWNPVVNADALEAEDLKELRRAEAKRKSGIAGLIDVILANAIAEVSNVHVRIEDQYGDDKVPCAVGILLERMLLTSVDENLRGTFHVDGFAERLRKMVQLERLGAYADFDSPSVCAGISNGWDGVDAEHFVLQMSAVFRSDSQVQHEPQKNRFVLPRAYLFGPLRGSAMYIRRGTNESADIPLHQVEVDMKAIHLGVRSTQLKVLYSLNAKRQRSLVRQNYIHIHPHVGVLGNAAQWWHFAIKGVLMHTAAIRKRRGLDFALSVDTIMKINRARATYIPLYLSHLREAPPPPECLVSNRAAQRNRFWPPKLRVGEIEEIDALEEELPLQSIILFRTLAHIEYRKSGGVKAAVARERSRRLGKKVIVKTVVGLAGGGARNTVKLVKNLTLPIVGIAKAVSRSDSNALVKRQKRAREQQQSVENEDDQWKEELESTVQLSERSAALENEALSATTQTSFSVTISNVSIVLVDDEVENAAQATREIFKVVINQVLLGQRSGLGRKEQRLLVQSLALVSPEGTLIDLNSSNDDNTAIRNGSAVRTLWGEMSQNPAIQMHVVRGDADSDKDVAISLRVKRSFTKVLRQPLERVRTLALRHRVTSAYIESFVYENESSQRERTSSMEQQSNIFKINPTMWLDIKVEPAVILLSGNDENVLVNLGSTIIKSLEPASAGVASDVAKQHNVFFVQTKQFQVGFSALPEDPFSSDIDQGMLNLLHKSDFDLTIVQNLNRASALPNLSLSFNLPKLELDASPVRIAKLRAVLKGLKPNQKENATPTVKAEAESDDENVFMLQLDERGDIKWIPSTICVERDHFLVIQTSDGLRSRMIEINLYDSVGASHPRQDIVDSIPDVKHVLTVGTLVQTMADLKASAQSETAVVLAFCGEHHSDPLFTMNSWQTRINQITREAMHTRSSATSDSNQVKTSSDRNAMISKVQIQVHLNVDRFSLEVMCPLRPHPAQENHSDMAIAEIPLAKLSFAIALGTKLASAAKNVEMKFDKVQLDDLYSNSGLGRDCAPTVIPSATVNITTRRLNDAEYDGVDNLIQVKTHGDVIVNIRRSTLLALIAFRFRLRPPGFKIVKNMPAMTTRLMIGNDLIRRVARDIRVNIDSIAANLYLDHDRGDHLKVGTVAIQRISWITKISPPTRVTELRLGSLKVATGKMLKRGEWNLQPSSRSRSDVVVLKNCEYDKGEDDAGADASLELELGCMDFALTPEVKEISQYFGFVREIRPGHIEPFVHPVDRPRDGFRVKKIRLAMDLNLPTVMIPWSDKEDGKRAKCVILKPGRLEISRSFDLKREGLCIQTTRIDVLGADLTVESDEATSHILNEKLQCSFSVQQRVDSGDEIVNQLDTKYDLKINPILVDVSGLDFRCLHDAVQGLRLAKTRPKVDVLNPIIWGDVCPLTAVEVKSAERLIPMEFRLSLSRLQISLFRLPLRHQPISTAKVTGIDVFAVRNFNKKESLELDVSIQNVSVQDDSGAGLADNSNFILYGNATGFPWFKLKLCDVPDQTSLHASVQYIEMLLRLRPIIDTVRAFSPRRLGGVYLARSVLPKDIFCVQHKTTKLKEDVILSRNSRLLADIYSDSQATYRLDGDGHIVFFADRHGEIIEDGGKIARKMIPRILIAPGATLIFENVQFYCTRTAFCQFIKVGPGGSYVIGENVVFSLFDRQNSMRSSSQGSLTSFDEDSTAAPSQWPAVQAAKKHLSENQPVSRARKIAQKPLILDVDMSCLHILIGEESTQSRLSFMFGVSASVTRDKKLHTTSAIRLDRLRTKDTMKPPLLAPTSASLTLEQHAEITRCTANMSSISFEFTPHRILILKNFVQQVAQSLAIAPILYRDNYSCVWHGIRSENSEGADFLLHGETSTTYTVWRPSLPTGYAMLGDIINARGAAPQGEVAVIRDVPALCALPIRFEKVTGYDKPAFWRPIPPQGFVSMGIIVSSSELDEPALDTVRCLREELVCCSGEVSELVSFNLYGATAKLKNNIWQMSNSVRTFAIADGAKRPNAYDIRMPIGLQVPKKVTRRRATKKNDVSKIRSITTVEFKKSASMEGKKQNVGFWQVIAPPGFYATGDCISIGEGPPLRSQVFAMDFEAFQFPESFKKLDLQMKRLDSKKISIWQPVPTEGFVAAGYVFTTDGTEPERESIVCIKEDLTTPIHETGELTVDSSIWSGDDDSKTSCVHFWLVDTVTNNFVVSKVSQGEKHPQLCTISRVTDAICPKFPPFQLKFNIDSVKLGIAFEKRFKNQAMFIMQLEHLILETTKADSMVTCSLNTELSLVHRNARQHHVIEPIIEPWKVSALLKNNGNKSAGPTGSVINILAAEKLRLLVNQMVFFDALSAMEQMRKPVDENAKVARLVPVKVEEHKTILNSTGRILWIQAPDGQINEVKPGGHIVHTIMDDRLYENDAKAGLEEYTKQHHVTSMARDNVDHHCSDRRLAAAHMIIDIMEIDQLRTDCLYPRITLKIWDRDLNRFRFAPLAVGAKTGSVKLSVLHPLLMNEHSNEYLHDQDIDVHVELSYTSSTGKLYTLVGVLPAPVAQQRSGWIPKKSGVWVECADEHSEHCRLKLRAHIVEGLSQHPIQTQLKSVLSGSIETKEEEATELRKNPPLIVCRSNDLVKTWWTKGKQSAKHALSVWQPCTPSRAELESRYQYFSDKSPEEYKLIPFGSILRSGLSAPRSALMAVVTQYSEGQNAPTAHPVTYENIWTSDKKSVSFWKPIPPEGYVAIGNVVSPHMNMPSCESYVCVREDLTEIAPVPPSAMWKSTYSFSRIARGKFCAFRTGIPGTGGWSFVQGRCSRDGMGNVCNSIPRMHQLSHRLCPQSFEDESIREMWVDTAPDEIRRKEELQPGEFSLMLAFAPDGPYEEVKLKIGTSHLIQHKTHNLLFNARRRELQGDITCANETGVDVRLSITQATGTLARPIASFEQEDGELPEREIQVFESERYYPILGWRTPRDVIIKNRFSANLSGHASQRFFPDLNPPKGYKFTGPWRLSMPRGRVDANGWAYANMWVTCWPPPRGSETRKARSTRRRRWTRPYARVKSDDELRNRMTLRDMRRDIMDDWDGEIHSEDSIPLPVCTRTGSYHLRMHAKERKLKSNKQNQQLRECSCEDDLNARPFYVGSLWTSSKDAFAHAYSNGEEHFLIVKEGTKRNMNGAISSIGVQMRILAPLKVSSSVHCPSHITVYTDGVERFSSELAPGQSKDVVTVDTTKEIAYSLHAKSRGLTLQQAAPLILNVTPAGQPAMPQLLWMDVAGYPHLTSPILVEAVRTKLVEDDGSNDEVQHLTRVTHRSALLITNATPFEMKSIASAGGASLTGEHVDSYGDFAPGHTNPALFLKTSVEQVRDFGEFNMALSIGKHPVYFKISLRSNSTTVSIPGAHGETFAFRCSAEIWENEAANASGVCPTVRVTVQPIVVAINLTHRPLAIRTNKLGHKLLRPASQPEPVNLNADISKSDKIDVETVINATEFQIADGSNIKQCEEIRWGQPMKSIVRRSGLWWNLPSGSEPSVAEINAFRRLPHVDEDGEEINLKSPLTIQCTVERGSNGCFRMFFTGGDGAASSGAPVKIVNFLDQPTLVRQVKNADRRKRSSKFTSRFLKKSIGEQGIGPSYAMRPGSAIRWAWSLPGVDAENSKRRKRRTVRGQKTLEICTRRGEKAVVCVDMDASKNENFMLMGVLTVFDERADAGVAAHILARWQNNTFHIYIVEPSRVDSRNLLLAEEAQHSQREIAVDRIRKELHVAIELSGFSMTMIDRTSYSAQELFHVSIDHVLLQRGSGLCLGLSEYNSLTIGRLQIDFSTHDASYPVFVWHDDSEGNLLDVHAAFTREPGASEIRLHHFRQQTAAGGLIIRAGEELLWTIISFIKSIKDGAPALRLKNGNLNMRQRLVTAKRQRRDSEMHIQSLVMDPISFVVTFEPNSDVRPLYADPRIVGLLTFANLNRLNFTLDKFEKHEQKMLTSALSNEFKTYMKTQIISHSLTLLSSMHTLSNVSTGLNAVSKAVETGFGTLTPSTRNLQRMPSSLLRTRMSKNTKASNLAHGVYIGLQRFGQGLTRGVVGMVTSPLRGVKRGGATGLFKGCFTGVADLVTKPTAGAIALAAKSVEGVANTARSVQSAAWNVVLTDKVVNAPIRRLPIGIGGDGVIRAWSERDALGVYMMRYASVQAGTLSFAYHPGSSDLYVAMHDVHADKVLVSTNQRMMCVVVPNMQNNMPSETPKCLWYISWSDVSSIWVEASVVICIQVNIEHERETSNLGSFETQEISQTARFHVRARSKQEAEQLEVHLRRCWNDHLDSLDV